MALGAAGRGYPSYHDSIMRRLRNSWKTRLRRSRAIWIALAPRCRHANKAYFWLPIAARFDGNRYRRMTRRMRVSSITTLVLDTVPMITPVHHELY